MPLLILKTQHATPEVGAVLEMAQSPRTEAQEVPLAHTLKGCPRIHPGDDVTDQGKSRWKE
jgi:hypothetical protein